MKSRKPFGKLLIKKLLKEAAADWLRLDSWTITTPVPDIDIEVSNKRAYSTGLCVARYGFFVMAGNPDLYEGANGIWRLRREHEGEDDNRNFILANPVGTLCEAHAVVLHELTHWALFSLLDRHEHDVLFNQMLLNAAEEITGRKFGKNASDMTSQQATNWVAIELYRDLI